MLIHNKIKTKLLVAAFSTLLGTASLSAEIVFSWTLDLSLASGTDAQQMDGASMTFIGTVTDTTYTAQGWGTDVTAVLPSFDIVVSGSGNANNNGTFAMTLDFYVPTTLTDNYGSFVALVNSGGGAAFFSFGDADAVMTLFGTKPENSSAVFGGPVSAADFEGATLNPDTLQISGSTYSFGSASISVVPEPASAAAFAGLATLCVACVGRRRRSARRPETVSGA